MTDHAGKGWDGWLVRRWIARPNQQSRIMICSMDLDDLLLISMNSDFLMDFEW